MKKLNYLLATALLCLGLVGCKSDDDPPKIKFTTEQLKMVFGSSQKKWRIIAHYDDYSYNRLNNFNDCYKDDLYIFKADTEEVEVTLGELGCYWLEPEEQVANVSYFYYEEEGRFYIEHSRGESNGNHFASIFFMLELEEISETRLLFAAGDKGEYSKALEFEFVE